MIMLPIPELAGWLSDSYSISARLLHRIIVGKIEGGSIIYNDVMLSYIKYEAESKFRSYWCILKTCLFCANIHCFTFAHIKLYLPFWNTFTQSEDTFWRFSQSAFSFTILNINKHSVQTLDNFLYNSRTPLKFYGHCF